MPEVSVQEDVDDDDDDDEILVYPRCDTCGKLTPDYVDACTECMAKEEERQPAPKRRRRRMATDHEFSINVFNNDSVIAQTRIIAEYRFNPELLTFDGLYLAVMGKVTATIGPFPDGTRAHAELVVDDIVVIHSSNDELTKDYISDWDDQWIEVNVRIMTVD